MSSQLEDAFNEAMERRAAEYEQRIGALRGEVNDLRDQVQMYEEKAERDWRDFGEMQDARIAADDRVVELEKELARVCKQLDSANDMVERARSLAHRSRCEGFSTERAFLDYWRGLYGAVDLDQLVWAIRFEVTTLTEIPASLTFAEAARIVESWSCCGQTFTGPPDFISGARSAHVCDIAPEDVPDAETAYAMGKAAALPDERLREALARANDDLILIADEAPEDIGESIDSVRAAIKDALAAADREKPDEDQT